MTPLAVHDPITRRNDLDSWWRSAVVYQIYPRSFADANGDGVGDIAGIRSKLPYLAALGVDAVWISPWYPSPMADAGYDVSDYRDIEPVFGTLDEADAMVAEAHALGIKVIIDIVPNHTSDQHVLFQEALAAGPGSPERDRYIFRPGRGENGELPPTDWQSDFGGPAWTRTTNPDGTPGDWYLRLFAPEQPDVNWDNAEIKAEFEKTLRFWFDRGVDGFRIDVAHAMVKDTTFPDVGDMPFPLPEGTPETIDHPHWDRPGVHEIFRSWRTVADEYTPSRAFCGEIWVGRAHRLVAYLRPDELHTAFNFDFLKTPWLPGPMRSVIDTTLASHAAVGAPPTWVLGNHDVCRPVSRYARDQKGVEAMHRHLSDYIGRPADFEAGLRRTRAAALMMFALPGGAYVYQGEELGLPEAEAIPLEAMQDPTRRPEPSAPISGRDGCRVPLPWTAEGATYGFSPEGAAAPWLPQPAEWAALAADVQDGVPGSTLEFYRAALALRAQHPALGDGTMRWLDTPPEALAFARDPGFVCWVNFGEEPLPLPAGATVLVASGPLNRGRVTAGRHHRLGLDRRVGVGTAQPRARPETGRPGLSRLPGLISLHRAAGPARWPRIPCTTAPTRPAAAGRTAEGAAPCRWSVRRHRCRWRTGRCCPGRWPRRRPRPPSRRSAGGGAAGRPGRGRGRSPPPPTRPPRHRDRPAPSRGPVPGTPVGAWSDGRSRPEAGSCPEPVAR